MWIVADGIEAMLHVGHAGSSGISIVMVPSAETVSPRWCPSHLPTREAKGLAEATDGAGGGAVTVGGRATGAGGDAAATAVVTGGDGTGCGRALFVVCLPKSVDTNRSSAAVMATTSTARPAHMSRPCRLVGISSVSSSTDQASSGSSPGGGGTWVVSASAPCSDAAVSSVLMEVTLGPLTGRCKRPY